VAQAQPTATLESPTNPFSIRITSQQAAIQAHAASDPTLFVLTYGEVGGGWHANTYDAVTDVCLQQRGFYPLASMPAAFGTSLFEINGNFTIGKYNLSDGSVIKANFITAPANKGTVWALASSLASNRLFVSTDLGIVEEYNATTGALINSDFLTKENSNQEGSGIQWPEVPSAGGSSSYPNGSNGEYGTLIVSGDFLYAAQVGPYWRVYNIATGARVSAGTVEYDFGVSDVIIGNNLYTMYADGGVSESSASYDFPINDSFIPAPAQTLDSGLAASSNYLYVANGNGTTVAQYTPDGFLVNPNFVVVSRGNIVALYVVPGVK
jgi:hypothetical protein